MHLPNDLQEGIVNYYREHFTSSFIPGQSAVPVSGKVFDADELIRGVEAVLDGWWTEGEATKVFEQRFAQYLGRPFCALTNSGSSANLLAFSALTSAKLGERRLRPGDEVITVAAGFPTTVAPIIQNGCVPVFVDIDIATGNATLEALQEAQSAKTKAVMLAHTLGNPFPVEEVAQWCKDHGYWLIEDACDALGGTYNGKKLGTFGHVSTFSFYPAHHITMGEGGAVVSSDALLNKIIRSFRDWGRDCWCPPGHDNTCGIRFGWKLGDLPCGYDHKYIYSEFGYNLKVTDMQSAIGLAQLEKLEGFIQARKDNHRRLLEALADLDHVFRLPVALPKADPSWFGFLLSIRADAPFQRVELLQYLNEKKIATRLLFAGNMLKQPMFKHYQPPHRVVGSLTATDDVMQQAFWIGCFPGIHTEQIAYMSDVLHAFCKEKGLI